MRRASLRHEIQISPKRLYSSFVFSQFSQWALVQYISTLPSRFEPISPCEQLGTSIVVLRAEEQTSSVGTCAAHRAEVLCVRPPSEPEFE